MRSIIYLGGAILRTTCEALQPLYILHDHRRMPRSSSAVWLISVRNVFVTVERCFKSTEQCKYYDVHRSSSNHIIYKKCHRSVYLLA